MNIKSICHLLIILIIPIQSCKDKYDSMERDPIFYPLEQKIKTDMFCEDVIIAVNNSDETTLEIYLINSKDTIVNGSKEEKAAICYGLSYKIIENYFEEPYKINYIEVSIVKKFNFMLRYHSSFSNKYNVVDISKDINERKEKSGT